MDRGGRVRARRSSVWLAKADVIVLCGIPDANEATSRHSRRMVVRRGPSSAEPRLHERDRPFRATADVSQHENLPPILADPPVTGWVGPRTLPVLPSSVIGPRMLPRCKFLAFPTPSGDGPTTVSASTGRLLVDLSSSGTMRLAVLSFLQQLRSVPPPKSASLCLAQIAKRGGPLQWLVHRQQFSESRRHPRFVTVGGDQRLVPFNTRLMERGDDCVELAFSPGLLGIQSCPNLAHAIPSSDLLARCSLRHTTNARQQSLPSAGLQR